MSGLTEATPIFLTSEERAELEVLARSGKTEHRTRLKAQIVLMAAAGTATRAIGRALGCTTGTASKWLVRYARKRLAGFSEVGNRGAAAKYDAGAGERILALLDQKPPQGYVNWTGPLLAKASATSISNMSGVSCGVRRSTFPGASRGASATIPNLPPMRRRLSGSMWRRPRTPSCSPSTKSRLFRRWSALKAA